MWAATISHPARDESPRCASRIPRRKRSRRMLCLSSADFAAPSYTIFCIVCLQSIFDVPFGHKHGTAGRDILASETLPSLRSQFSAIVSGSGLRLL